MTLTAWRITQTTHADDAFSGIGAWLEGARWNHKGVNMVYTAESISLTALEMIVNLPEEALLYKLYVRIPVQFDAQHVMPLKPSQLPFDWNLSPPPEAT